MAPLKAVHFLFFVYLGSVAAQDWPPSSTKQQPSTVPVAGQLTSQGCYKSLSSTADDTPENSVFMSVGTCGDYCQEAGKTVAIVQERLCYCADTYPPQDSLVDDAQCYRPCPGYAPDACGGEGVFSVFNTGIDVDVRHDGAGSSASDTSVATSSVATSSAATSSAATSSAATSSAATSSAATSSVATSSVISTAAQSTPGSSSSVADSTASDKISTTAWAPSNSAPATTTKSGEAVSSPSPSPTTIEKSNDSSRGRSNVAFELKNKIQGLFFKASGRQALKRSTSSNQKSGRSGNKLEL